MDLLRLVGGRRYLWPALSRNLDLDADPVPFHFVAQNVAFLAWDKRGVRDSGGVFEPLADDDADAQLARLRLLAADAAAAITYLAGRDDLDPERTRTR